MTTAEKRGVFHSTKELEWFDVLPGEQVAYRVNGEDVNGAYAIFDLLMAPEHGNGPVAIHHNADEIFRVVDGEVRFHVDGREFDAATGDVVVVPKGTPHAFLNIGEKPLHLSIMFTPSGDELLFKEVPGKSFEEILELAKRFNVSVVGEPIKK